MGFFPTSLRHYRKEDEEAWDYYWKFVDKERQENFDNCNKKEKMTKYCLKCKKKCMAHYSFYR